MANTWVIVDDFDPAIRYTGNWAWTQAVVDDVSSEIAFDNSGHVVGQNSVNATDPPASFFYSFNGSSIAVYGIAASFNQSVQVPGPTLPQWECIIDDTLVLPNHNPYGVFPLESYCESESLDDGSHTLEFRVTTSGIGLWVDSLRYMPTSKDVVPANASAWIASTDSRLDYGPGWTPLGQGSMTTSTTMATPFEDRAFYMDYNGSSLTWYGFSRAAIEKARPDLPALSIVNSTTTSGYYQVDNGLFLPFGVDLSMQTVGSELNPYTTILFRTPIVAPGPHNISVFYDGNSTVWPLTLDYITVDVAFTDSVVSPVDAIATSKSKSAVIGGAVGGILGGILLIFLGLLIVRQRRIRRQQSRNSRALHFAKNDIKLRPFSKLEDPEEKGTTQQYPFSLNRVKNDVPT